MKQCPMMSRCNRISLLFLILAFTFNLLEFSNGKEQQKLNAKDPSHRKQVEAKEVPANANVVKADAVKQANKVAHDSAQPVKQAQVVKNVIEKPVKKEAKIVEEKPVKSLKEVNVKKSNEQQLKVVTKKPVAKQPVAKEPKGGKEQPVVPKEPVVEPEEPEEDKKQPVSKDESKDSDNGEENAVNENQTPEEGEKEKEAHETMDKEDKPEEKKEGLGVGKVLKKQGHTEGTGYKLAKDARCAEDVKQLCSSLPKDNNFAILVCLQDAAVQDDDQVTDDCHQLLWEYKSKLTMSTMFDTAAFEVCESFMSEMQDCKNVSPDNGRLVNCLIEHREHAKDQKCRAFLHKMASIVYGDYRLIYGFYQACKASVVKHNCGKIQTKNENDPHTQAEVIECLEDNLTDLPANCQAEIKKVAELSSDDYHMDRAIFYACQDARDRFCSGIQAGEGRIYKCLMEHKAEETMAEDCRDKLTVRQQLMQKDVKVNHPLWEHCQKYYEENKCKTGDTENGKSSHLILCLNAVIAEGKKEIDAKCQAEMQDFAAQLFADYKLSPEVVAHCDKELQENCKNEMKPDGGAIDCLMGVGDKLGDTCYKAIHDVLKETNAGGDFKIDKPLHMKCQSFIDSKCKDQPESLVLSCLMDNIRSEAMPKACQTELFHLQYFLARDFSLDEELYKDCKEDAKKICNAPDFSGDFMALPPGMVVACLYRNSMPDAKEKVSRKCSDHVKRVMHTRASNYKLLPQIQAACVTDLGTHCIAKDKEGEEVKCLQDHYDVLDPPCRDAVANFTENESEDIELDKELITSCAPMVLKFCQDVVKEGNSEGVLPCLILNKHHVDMDMKCTASIEHWQILELKDLRFAHKLKKACFKDIQSHCSDSKTKLDAVKCLSLKIKEGITKNQGALISLECQEQVREELVEEHEDIMIQNPEFSKACTEDVDKLCKKFIHQGQAKAEECLRQNENKLSKDCYKELFKVELEEVEDPSLDYELTHVCKPMIKKFCMDQHPKKFLSCLREHTNDVEMTTHCRDIVFERQKEGSKDFRLDPDIAEFCLADVNKFCKTIAEKDNRGAVMACLKKQIEAEKLSDDCLNFVRMRIEEAALDYRLDPVLEEACADEMKKFCSQEMQEKGHGKMTDCLKENYSNFKSKACKEEVKRLVGEAMVDVHADPHLSQTCNVDVQKFCDHTLTKEGKVIECLLEVYSSKNLKLVKGCRKLLRKRMELWSAVDVTTHFQSLSDIMDQVHASPRRQYIYTVTLCILAVIFVGGLFCGRITKRVAREYKDR